jgi:L-ascorbate metabolism protein UlaG (beta-lactamase superfamily)
VRITKFTHSCLRIDGDGVLVVDPGGFSERSALDGADAVLITHEHPDHVDVAALAEAGAGLHVYAHADVLATLRDFEGETTAIEPGQKFTAAGFGVSAYGGQHAVIYPEIPVITNVAFLIDDGDTNLYHPGDSFVAPRDATVDTLFVPLNAPWMKLAESIDFVRAVRPGRAYALHDALLTAAGAKISDGHLERFSGTAYAHVAPGTVID